MMGKNKDISQADSLRVRKLFFLFSEYTGFLENYVKQSKVALETITSAHNYFSEKMKREMEDLNDQINKPDITIDRDKAE